MLDSLQMSGSDQNPPTLASLRTRKTKPRTTNKSAQPCLLFTDPEEPQKLAPKKLPTGRRIWTVRDLVSDVRHQIESNYTDLWVEGEISNLRAAPSGHLYFTLKD